MSDDAHDATGFLHCAVPLSAGLGVRAVETSASRVVLEMDGRADLWTVIDALHGGALTALADTGGGACAFANLPAGSVGTSTIESKTTQTQAVLRPQA
jgi:1,4-dihydroxy-2-naphthoyl-CoA hydrolase